MNFKSYIYGNKEADTILLQMVEDLFRCGACGEFRKSPFVVNQSSHIFLLKGLDLEPL